MNEKRKTPPLFCWSLSSRLHTCTLALPGSMSSALLAALATENGTVGGRQQEKMPKEKTEMPSFHRKLGSYNVLLLMLPHVCLEVFLQDLKLRDTPPSPANLHTL